MLFFQRKLILVLFVASSPGLDYVWRDSGTYNIVLSTLGIDSRIVVSYLSRRNKY